MMAMIRNLVMRRPRALRTAARLPRVDMLLVLAPIPSTDPTVVDMLLIHTVWLPLTRPQRLKVASTFKAYHMVKDTCRCKIFLYVFKVWVVKYEQR